MNNKISPYTSPEEVLSIIREHLARQEHLLEQVVVHLQQHSDAHLRQHSDMLRHEHLLEQIVAHFQQPPEQTPVWVPPDGFRGVNEPIKPIRKIRKVRFAAHHQIKAHDIVGRLRSTWLGRIYTSHLKQHGIIRWLTAWVWRNGYPLYVNFIDTRFLNRREKRWRPLIKQGEFARIMKLPIYNLADAANVALATPEVSPTRNQDLLAPTHDRYIFPEIFAAIISNALTYGGTNLILAGENVVCHDLYDFNYDATSEELHGRTLIEPKAMRIRLLLRDDAPEKIPAAASFVDACASNYAHWLTEVLPRIALFCADARFAGVPIVIDADLHPNIMASLFLVAGTEREIITLPINRALAVDKLYLVSVTGYVPWGRRTNKLSGHSHGVFSPQALTLLRNMLNDPRLNTKGIVWPKKIFLRRNSGTRKVSNADEIEEILVARGYTIVVPEKLTFLQQVQLFNNAEEVVSSTGAALANAIFCRPGAHVVILMANHQDMIYRYWCNMLMPLKVITSYVLGDIVKNHDLGIHGDFAIDTADLIDILDGEACK